MQLDRLEFAGCTLDRYITADNSRPSFLEITGIATQRSPTCSGLNAGDYRNLAALLNHPNLSQLKIQNKVPLPPEIMEHFAHMQCHCLMGVFPEISRVWLAIDSNIYVWAFEHGSDVAYFDGLGETIVSVGLVKPKPGVFQNFVKYLLVLTTTVEIVVLGVTFSSSKGDDTNGFEEIHLVPEPVFVLPTDGVPMMSVKSTAKGRIFLGGKDGCLYEITYQAQLGWFGKHCKKVNHSTSALSFLVPSFLNAALYDEDPIVKIEVDNSRHILYTLSEKGCIEVFDLGPDGETISKVVRLTQGNIVSSAVEIVKTLEAYNFKPVVSISAVDESESEHLNLVAVTQTGARLYFSTGSGDANQGGSSRPVYLTLLHVRLPPGFTSNAAVLKPKRVHSACYENGSLVMVCSGNSGEAETLWCLSRVLPAPGFSEAHTVLALDGPAWALTSLPPPPAGHPTTAVQTRRARRTRCWPWTAPPGRSPRCPPRPPDTPLLQSRPGEVCCTQGCSCFSEAHTVLALDGPAWALTSLPPPPPAGHPTTAVQTRRDAQYVEVWSTSRWAVVTGAGAALLTAGAAPDILRTLLRDCRGPDAQPVKDFFQLQSVEQACACALYLACEDATSGDLSVSEWATRAFYLYGAQTTPSQPTYSQHQTQPIASTIGNYTSIIMKCLVCNVAFYLYGAQTTPSQPTYSQHQTQPIASTIGNYTSIIMKCLVCNVAFYLYGAQTTPSQPTYSHQTQPIASTIGNYTSIIMKCLVCNVAFYLYGAQTTPSQPTYSQHQTQPIASTIGNYTSIVMKCLVCNVAFYLYGAQTTPSQPTYSQHQTQPIASTIGNYTSIVMKCLVCNVAFYLYGAQTTPSQPTYSHQTQPIASTIGNYTSIIMKCLVCNVAFYLYGAQTTPSQPTYSQHQTQPIASTIGNYTSIVMKCLVCNVAFYLYGAQTTPSQPTYSQHQTQPIASTIGNYTSIVMKCLVCNVAFYLYGAQTTSQPTAAPDTTHSLYHW
ncbi:hypothetical protein NE865_14194 [Phthorimaea operculella]|nr:hypothetical protein NE865_14194 [Phthorimaea operculella]